MKISLTHHGLVYVVMARSVFQILHASSDEGKSFLVVNHLARNPKNVSFGPSIFSTVTLV